MKAEEISEHADELYCAIFGDDDRMRDKCIPTIRSKLNEIALQTEVDLMKSSGGSK